MADDAPLDLDIDRIMAEFAARREAPLPSPNDPADACFVWHTLVEHNKGIIRAALDPDGDLYLQCLSMIKRYRALLVVPKGQFPHLRALLDGALPMEVPHD
jgi:hypothetical protein